VLAVFLAQAFFRFQRHDTDSQLTGADLVGQRATVIVPLDDKTMGKVRVQVGLVVTEQYALAAHAGAAFQTGDEVMVASVTDECVYVR
jgi:membrane protein implicated in regulation of membrane protease activity